MFDPELFWTAYWPDWRHAEILTIREAACLLTGNDPSRYGHNSILPSEAAAIELALEHAVRLGTIRPFAVWGWNAHGDREPLDIDAITPHAGISNETSARISELRRWADAKDIAHYWPESEYQPKTGLSIEKYPPELRAAIEAFDAVHANPALASGKSFKSALSEWLEANKPELSANARERVATVANAQPSGGAPKTPGG